MFECHELRTSDERVIYSQTTRVEVDQDLCSVHLDRSPNVRFSLMRERKRERENSFFFSLVTRNRYKKFIERRFIVPLKAEERPTPAASTRLFLTIVRKIQSILFLTRVHFVIYKNHAFQISDNERALIQMYITKIISYISSRIFYIVSVDQLN